VAFYNLKEKRPAYKNQQGIRNDEWKKYFGTSLRGACFREFEKMTG
jgi:hypothetical protein